MARKGPTTSYGQAKKDKKKDLLGRSVKGKKVRKAAMKAGLKKRRSYK